MACQTERLSQLCALVNKAERHQLQIRNGKTESEREQAELGFARTLNQIYDELCALKQSGTLDALDMLVHTLGCRQLFSRPQ